MALSEEAKKKKSKYNSERSKKVGVLMAFQFQKATDMDVVERIKSQPNKVGYIRDLVRADIEREKQAKQNPDQK